MAVVSGPQMRGDLTVHVMKEPWSDGTCICVEAADGRIYMTVDEAVKFHNEMDDVLEKLGCTPVSIEVEDESEGVTP